MQQDPAVNGFVFGWLNEFGLAHSDGMQRSIKVVGPEIEELCQNRKAGGDVEMLPEEFMEQIGVIGQVVEMVRN